MIFKKKKLPVVQEEKLLPDISYLELWRPFFSACETVSAILVKGIMRNNFVKLC